MDYAVVLALSGKNRLSGTLATMVDPETHLWFQANAWIPGL